MKRILVTGLFATLFLLAGAGSALAAPPAYIDPNTGGMLAQALIVLLGMATGAWFFFANRIKMGYNRLMRSFREKKDEPVVQVQEGVTPEAPQENNIQ